LGRGETEESMHRERHGCQILGHQQFSVEEDASVEEGCRRGGEEDAEVGEGDTEVKKGAAVVGKKNAKVGEGDVDVGEGAVMVGKEPSWWGRRTPRLGKKMSMWGRSHYGGGEGHHSRRGERRRRSWRKQGVWRTRRRRGGARPPVHGAAERSREHASLLDPWERRGEDASISNVFFQKDWRAVAVNECDEMIRT